MVERSSARLGWDEVTFEAYFRAHVQQVVRFTERRLVGNEAVWDVVAEIFAAAWRRSPDAPTSPDAALAWLYGIGGNVVRNAQRADRRRQALMSRVALNLAASDEDAYDAVDDRITAQRRVYKVFGELAESDQEVLSLVAWEGLGMAALSVALGVSEAAAKKRAQRARQRLRRALLEVHADLARGNRASGPLRPAPGRK